MATKTAVIVLCDDAVLIWAIPPLSPQPLDFFDHHPTHLPPPLFTITFPNGISLHHESPHAERIGWKTISSWYFGSSHDPLYFDMLCLDSKLHRFQIILKPDLSSASLHVIHTELTPHDFNCVSFQDYRICEDTLVSCWFYEDDHHDCGVYTGLTSARFADIISHGGPAAKMLLPDMGRRYTYLSSCPASGRVVLLDTGNNLAILDLF